MNSSRICLITNDVETTSLWNHCLSDKTGEIVLKEGMPRLLSLYKDFNIKATFFFTGYIAKKFPEIVRMVIPEGHEVGCHGYSHHYNQAFDCLTYEEQLNILIKSKKILEDISGQEVISLRINEYTPKALIMSGFLIDSSVASQRGDMFFSLGSKRKLDWLSAPRLPYLTSTENLCKRGQSPIFEIPISAFLFPYIGTILRIAPAVTCCLRELLHIENCMTGKPLVFLIHPNEIIHEDIIMSKIDRRSKNILHYLLSDILRYKIKLRNLGEKAILLYEQELSNLSRKKYKFITCKEYYEIKIGN